MEQELKNKYEVYKSYLMCKFREQDWHGVWDMAVDLQIIKEKLELIQMIEEQNKQCGAV